jgi:hypothetical protein
MAQQLRVFVLPIGKPSEIWTGYINFTRLASQNSRRISIVEQFQVASRISSTED